MTSKIRTAVLGLGNMGRHHVRNLSQLENAELVAVCDPKDEVLASFQSDYSCEGFSYVESLISSGCCDAVVIAAPTLQHHDLVTQFLTAGIHVFVEKPLTHDASSSEEMVALAKEKSLVLAVGHIERFNPAVTALYTFVSEGGLGDIVAMRSHRASPYPKQIFDANVLIDLAVHDIDVMTYLVGNNPIKVTGHSGKGRLTDRDDFASIFLDYGRASGLVAVDWLSPDRIRYLDVTGSKGLAHLDFIAKTVEIRLDDQTFQLDVDEKDAIAAELDNFLTSIQTGSEPLVSGQVGLDALRVIAALS